MKKILVSIILIVGSFLCTEAQLLSAVKTSLDLTAATIVVDEKDFVLVQKAAQLLQQDIEAVTGKKIALKNQLNKTGKNNIIIGTVAHGRFTRQMLANNKAAAEKLSNTWEGYHIQTINGNLVIAGSDRRGLAYGVFELSRQIGVSPWYWWADVPVKKQTQLFINTATILTDAPKVKYRGIFINDEAPALSNWSREKFGGFNHRFYEKVFELMLRLKANYLWPAMWGNAFYYDDSLNIKSADDFGIVIGTSHHEPLMRAHEEWKYAGAGKWNYDSNEVSLKAFWKGGMQRATNEKIVSIGMRGDGDEPMSRETATALLERIVKDQREIIRDVTGKPADQTPQLWALYKEVQDYYDKGMRVPDDVTLLLCDDNWGNIRKLPKLTEPARKGGYGIYYHFDYVGGPRNYKWLNTNPIPRVWEQMHLAWEYNARQIWIVNVGDIKPMEFPISFFLDYAWNPEKISANDLQSYTQQWTAAQFGNKYSKEIAEIISTYSKYNGRRKPELLDQHTYSLWNYKEAGKVTEDYNDLLRKAAQWNDSLPVAYRDAYYQLVLHPVEAGANLQALYTAVAENKKAYDERSALVNDFAKKAAKLFVKDSLISERYHRLNGGKWNHMMSQTHIGYTYWQQPLTQKMPAVNYLSTDSMVLQPAPRAHIEKTATPDKTGNKNLFFEKEYSGVSIEADHFTTAVNSNGITWTILPDHGKTGSAITAFPVTAAVQQPAAGAPHLEYEFYSFSKDSFLVNAFFSPTLNFHNSETGLRYAISIDEEKPQVIGINKESNVESAWGKWVANNIIIKKSAHYITEPGKHILKFWMVDPGVVLQKLVVDF